MREQPLHPASTPAGTTASAIGQTDAEEHTQFWATGPRRALVMRLRRSELQRRANGDRGTSIHGRVDSDE
jgi:hypothetical protein